MRVQRASPRLPAPGTIAAPGSDSAPPGPQRRESSWRGHVWGASIVAYLALVAVDVLLRRDLGVLDATALGSSPARIAAGEVGRLFTSGLIVAGSNPGIQLAGTAVLTALFVHRHGARAWWGAALSGHLGSALVAYTLIGLLLLLDAASVDQVLDQPDFGISCVLAGTLGGLVGGALLRLRRGVPPERRRPELAVAAASVAAFLVFIPFSLGFYGVEHPLAFLFGAGFMLARERWLARRRSRARDMLATASRAERDLAMGHLDGARASARGGRET